jgi:hypothetical protein
MNAPAQTAPTRNPVMLLAVIVFWIVLVVLLFLFGGRWFGPTSAATLKQHLVAGTPLQRRDALLEVAGRMKRQDPERVQFYPAILQMTSSPDPIVRGGAAWAMGNDPSRQDFHQALLKMLADAAPNVQANASVSLARFNDSAGRQHLLDMLRAGNPDGVWEALRALKAVGTKEDLAAITPYEAGAPNMPERVRAEAQDAARAIRERN